MSHQPATRPLCRAFYVVVCDHSGGGFLHERNVTDLDRATVIKDIADAQYDDILQILECDPAANTCRDVTREIAREACDRLDNLNDDSPDWQKDIAALAGLQPSPVRRISPAAFDLRMANYDRTLAIVAEEIGA